jgi:hypothetical protein
MDENDRLMDANIREEVGIDENDRLMDGKCP